MRKWLIVLVSTVLSLSLSFPAVANEKEGPRPEQTLYKADVHFDPKKKQVEGSVEIQFWPKDASHAYVHVYPLAFTKEHKGELWDELLGKEVELGTYDENRILVQGKPVAVKRTGNVIEVPLSEEQSRPIVLSMDFTMTLPQNEGRMSYDEHAIWLGNWLPILAVKDQRGWHLDPYEPIGDPFFSENADYQVNVTLPDGYQLASTATDQAAIVDHSTPGQREFQLDAINVRDFALVIMDSTYHFKETKVGNTEVRTWYRNGDSEEQASRNHTAAVEALQYFNSQFETYPYTEYDVVRVGGSINGMEYPSIVFLDGRHYLPNGDNAFVTVVHETAHQWFYSLIGNNQVDEAWLDEGFAEYATLAFLAAKYPKVGADRVLRRLKQGTITPYYVQEHLRPGQTLHAFPDNESYSDLVYSRTSSMLWMLREAWGEERLHEVLRHYVSTNRFGIANAASWKATLSEAAGEDAGAFLSYWINLDMSKQEEAAIWLEKLRQNQKNHGHPMEKEKAEK